MKTLLFTGILSLLLCRPTTAQVNQRSNRVSGYNKSNGTHVNAYRRTEPNRTQRDNYDTKGNTNPYTGKSGSRSAKH